MFFFLLRKQAYYDSSNKLTSVCPTVYLISNASDNLTGAFGVSLVRLFVTRLSDSSSENSRTLVTRMFFISQHFLFLCVLIFHFFKKFFMS